MDRRKIIINEPSEKTLKYFNEFKRIKDESKKRLKIKLEKEKTQNDKQ